jgi:hypothetical protein
MGNLDSIADKLRRTTCAVREEVENAELHELCALHRVHVRETEVIVSNKEAGGLVHEAVEFRVGGRADLASLRTSSILVQVLHLEIVTAVSVARGRDGARICAETYEEVDISGEYTGLVA